MNICQKFDVCTVCNVKGYLWVQGGYLWVQGGYLSVLEGCIGHESKSVRWVGQMGRWLRWVGMSGGQVLQVGQESRSHRYVK